MCILPWLKLRAHEAFPAGQAKLLVLFGKNCGERLQVFNQKSAQLWILNPRLLLSLHHMVIISNC